MSVLMSMETSMARHQSSAARLLKSQNGARHVDRMPDGRRVGVRVTATGPAAVCTMLDGNRSRTVCRGPVAGEGAISKCGGVNGEKTTV